MAAISSAWIGVVGALGGVAITSVIGLVTAWLSRRWTSDDRKRDQDAARTAARRTAYARYLSAAEALYNSMAGYLYDPDWLSRFPRPHGDDEMALVRLAVALRNAEPTRWDEFNTASYEAKLVAASAVLSAIDAFEERQYVMFNAMMVSEKPDADAVDFAGPVKVLINVMRIETSEDARLVRAGTSESR
jgi:hypothetical protein